MILIITLCVSYVNANKFVFNEYSIKQLAFDEGFINKVLEILQGIGDNTTDNMDAVNETITDGNSTLTTDDDIIDDIKPVEDDVPLRETATESTESLERHDGFIVPEFENVGQKRFRTVGHQPMETKFTAGATVAKEGTKDPVKVVTGFIADLFKVKPDTS